MQTAQTVQAVQTMPVTRTMPTMAAMPMMPMIHGPIPVSVTTLLAQAKQTWAEAVLEPRAAEKYRTSHVAALRAAAAILALRAQPAIRRRPTSAWVLLDGVAPELGDWSAYFADSAQRRAAIEAGASRVVSERDADDLLRAAGEFIAIVERMVGALSLGVAS